MGQLVTTQQLRQRSYIPAWQAWVKKTISTTQAEETETETGPPDIG